MLMEIGYWHIAFIGLFLLLAGCASPNPPSSTLEQGLEETIPATPLASAPSSQAGNAATENTQVASPPSTEEIVSSESLFDGLTPNAETSLIFQALNDAGISDPAVEYQTDQVLVAYNLPAGMDMEGSVYFTFGVVSKFAQPIQLIWVQVFSGSTSKTYSVKADTVQKYTAGKLNENQLKLAVTVQ